VVQTTIIDFALPHPQSFNIIKHQNLKSYAEYRYIGVGTYLFVKVPQSGDSGGT